MNGNDIKKWQAKKISDALYQPTNYLIRLRQRMEQRGFPPNDSLYQLVCAAHDAVNRLRIAMYGPWNKRHFSGTGGWDRAGIWPFLTTKRGEAGH
jgi:hypothetical protein